MDEEQRFGVSHKERLKELSRGVDVLTLSATPIPRTLNMALSGLRDMSTIEQPPQDRYPVQTFVLEYNERVLDTAIRRELERGGQVYYLHNRVESIDQCAARLRERLGEVEVAVAHGKMNEEQLGSCLLYTSRAFTKKWAIAAWAFLKTAPKNSGAATPWRITKKFFDRLAVFAEKWAVFLRFSGKLRLYKTIFLCYNKAERMIGGREGHV